MPPRTPSEPPARQRRQPAQARAIETRSLIFEAAIRVLEAEGLEGFNTNRLAAESGYAVGTIYQYFGNKRELLAALARREVDQALTSAQRNLAASPANNAQVGSDPLDRIRANVRAMAALLLRQGLVRADGQVLRLDEHEAFVLTQALMGVVRSAVLSEPARLKQPGFEDALVRLVAGFLGVTGSAKN
jgi:AcrR family transcriptional regulator